MKKLAEFWIITFALTPLLATGFHLGWMMQAFNVAYALRVHAHMGELLGAFMVSMMLAIVYIVASGRLLETNPTNQARLFKLLGFCASFALVVGALSFTVGYAWSYSNTTYDVATISWGSPGLKSSEAVYVGQSAKGFILVPYDRSTNTLITSTPIDADVDGIELIPENLGHPHKRAFMDTDIKRGDNRDLSPT